MAPTDIKTVNQTSSLHNESNLDRLGLLSPTHDQRSQQQTGQIALQPVLINKSRFLKATHCTKIRKLKYRGPWWWRPWAGEAGARASIQPSKALCILAKSPTNLARSPLLVALVERNKTVVGHQFFPQRPPGSSLWFSRTGVQPSPDSSTIELPSAFAESGAYPPDRTTRLSATVLPASRVPPPSRRAPNWSLEEARTWEHHPQPTIPPPCLNRQAESRWQPVGCVSWGWTRPYTRRKDPPILIPRNQVSEGEGTWCNKPLFFSREGFSRFFPSSTVKSNFVY